MTSGPLATAAGGGGAPTDAQYVVMVANATLTQERILTGTASRIVVADGGAGAAVTLSPGALIVQTDQANTWTVGNQIIQPAVDTTTAFQVFDADGGAPVLSVDTVSERVGIGIAAPTRPLSVLGETIGGISRGFSVDATSLGDQRAILGSFIYSQSNTNPLNNSSFGMIIGNQDTTANNYAAFGFSMQGGAAVGGILAMQFVNHAALQSDWLFVVRNGSLKQVLTIKYHERVGINEAAPGSALQITNKNTTIPALILKAAAAQTENGFEYQDSTGAARAWIDEFGGIAVSKSTDRTLAGANSALTFTLTGDPIANTNAVYNGVAGQVLPVGNDDFTGAVNGVKATIQSSNRGTISQINVINAAIITTAAGTVTNAYNLRVQEPNITGGGTLVSLYGLHIADIDQGVTNYAIYTNLGDVRFGDRVINATATLSAVGPTDNQDAAGINILFIDASGNNVTLGGFINGVSGQTVHVVVTGINGATTVTVENIEGTGNQDIYLSSGGDESLANSYGGWTLVCNGTHWYEVEQ